jgi:hypothetical protein
MDAKNHMIATQYFAKHLMREQSSHIDMAGVQLPLILDSLSGLSCMARDSDVVN